MKQTATQTPASRDAQPVAVHDELIAALAECRDILCSLMTEDAVVKLAYMMPNQIPAAVRRGYLALQAAGHPAAQEGAEK